MRVLDFADGFESTLEPTGGSIGVADFLDFNEAGVSGNPAALDRRMHVNASGQLVLRNSAGVDLVVGAAGDAPGFRWFLDNNPPAENNVADLEVLDFDRSQIQRVFGMVKVGVNYVPGTQISLDGGLFATQSVTGNVLMRGFTRLIQPGTTIFGTYSDAHTSINTEVTASPNAGQITSIGSIALTSPSGTINAIPIASNDLLLVRLTRENGDETSSTVEDARVLRNSFEVVT